MKHPFYRLMALSFFSTTSLLVSMNKPETIKFQEITAVENPGKVAFAANGELIIGYDKGTQATSGVYLANWKENRTILKVFNNIFLYPYCFRNQQRNAIVVNPLTHVAVYDLKGQEIYRLNREFCVSTCTANGTVYAVEPDGTMHNNESDKTFILPVEDKKITFNPLTAHYTKERIFLPNGSPNNNLLFTQ